MWYGILPIAGAVVMFIHLPYPTSLILHHFFLEHWYDRDCREKWDRKMVFRDQRLGNGRWWKTQGLETIPDE